MIRQSGPGRWAQDPPLRQRKPEGAANRRAEVGCVAQSRVLGCTIAATRMLTVHVAVTLFRVRTCGAGASVALSGIASLGYMAAVNVLMDSPFTLPLTALAALSHARGK